jgi:hypothetical protein
MNKPFQIHCPPPVSGTIRCRHYRIGPEPVRIRLTTIAALALSALIAIYFAAQFARGWL